MSAALAIMMLTFGCVAGWLGWRHATKPIYRRSIFEPDLPFGVSRRRHERAVRRHRKLWRIVLTLLCAIAGAGLGGIFLLLVSSRF
jgi:TRAP-type C4-dicarboxylate transport system permease small subunit